MNAQLEAIITEIQGMRDELDALEVKMERTDILRRNIRNVPIRDSYCEVDAVDLLEGKY